MLSRGPQKSIIRLQDERTIRESASAINHGESVVICTVPRDRILRRSFQKPASNACTSHTVNQCAVSILTRYAPTSGAQAFCIVYSKPIVEPTIICIKRCAIVIVNNLSTIRIRTPSSAIGQVGNYTPVRVRSGAQVFSKPTFFKNDGYRIGVTLHGGSNA